jgi:hypothetical protein
MLHSNVAATLNVCAKASLKAGRQANLRVAETVMAQEPPNDEAKATAS